MAGNITISCDQLMGRVVGGNNAPYIRCTVEANDGLPLEKIEILKSSIVAAAKNGGLPSMTQVLIEGDQTNHFYVAVEGDGMNSPQSIVGYKLSEFAAGANDRLKAMITQVAKTAGIDVATLGEEEWKCTTIQL